MVDDSGPHIIAITESLVNKDVIDAELGVEGYAIFGKTGWEEEEDEYYYT